MCFISSNCCSGHGGTLVVKHRNWWKQGFLVRFDWLQCVWHLHRYILPPISTTGGGDVGVVRIWNMQLGQPGSRWSETQRNCHVWTWNYWPLIKALYWQHCASIGSLFPDMPANSSCLSAYGVTLASWELHEDCTTQSCGQHMNQGCANVHKLHFLANV